jgi:hypothetical protein
MMMINENGKGIIKIALERGNWLIFKSGMIKKFLYFWGFWLVMFLSNI